ncbi:hypothetical protein [Streptomyces sp. G-G2]|uniref:hypothetical protein n=1 Tax=Streptomyces sp. G-G2 TaxID=3046201 RepID=UPI0024B94257|nr:hypothetical protein [Streptomyces sp. G-G2]MDJ0382596.1 hypothetical protein [Streptomyces sp. G-G2]
MVRSSALTLAAAATLAVAAVAAPPASATRADPGRARADRALTYRATARYQRHDAAVRAGYVPDRYCVQDPAGSGALGYPHFRHAYDNSLDPAKPAALFYEDDGHGGKRLLGVQWVVYDRDQDVRTDDDRPTLLGQHFTGPHRGHFPGQPVHYALHLWLWKDNPDGAFQTYNPAVTCRPGTTRPKP